jgi:DNA polymerase V
MLRERRSVSPSAPRSRVAISFGSPAGESGVTRLDLNEILISHPQAAFLVRIAGSAMRDAGIDDGDLALVDRAIDASHGQVVIAVHQDEFLCRRLCRRGEALGLQATDSSVADVWAGDVDVFDIWGVVTHVVKQVSS